MNPLIQKLEAAILARNPALAQLLQPGLSAAQIRKDLKRGKIEGAIEPLVDLYSWRNGTQLHGTTEVFNSGIKGGFAPPRTIPLSEADKEFMRAIGVKRDSTPEHYHLIGLKMAIGRAKSNPPAISGRFFPFLWETGDCKTDLALDLYPYSGNRVVQIKTVKTKDEHPVWEAYDSFDDFLMDAIRSNENNQPLRFLGVETKPIVLDVAPASPAKAATEGHMIPIGESSLALRTDFSDEAAWKSLVEALNDPDNEFETSLNIVSDPRYAGVTPERLLSLLPKDSPPTFAFIIDRVALTRPEFPVLAVDLQAKSARTFRVTASALALVDSNLSIGNMDFTEFADAAGEDGIFRGL